MCILMTVTITITNLMMNGKRTFGDQKKRFNLPAIAHSMFYFYDEIF